MSMSRKDFKAITTQLKANYPFQAQEQFNHPQLLQWQSDVLAVARALNQTNPNFNHSLFCQACIPTNEEQPPTTAENQT